MNCAKGLRSVGITAWDLILYVRREFTEKVGMFVGTMSSR